MKCTSTCSNCEPDDGEFLTLDVLKDVSIDQPEESITTTCVEEDSNSDSSTSSSYSSSPSINIVKIELEECSIGYFAGYLAKKCLVQFKCTNCELNLTKIDCELNDKSLLLLLHKSYDNFCPTQGLKAPSEQLLQIVNICLEVFKKWFPIIKSSKKIVFQLKEKANKKINMKFPDLQKSKCIFHYIYIVELLFKTKIFKECKWENAQIGKRNLQNADKLRIFKNK